MADRQISDLTALTSPADADMLACEQSSTAKKLTLSVLKNWLYKINTNISSVASSLTGSEFFLMQTGSNAAKKVSANTIKSFCGGGSGGAGVFYATYDITPYEDVKAAYDAGKIIFLKPNPNNFWPLWRYYEATGTGEVQMNWYDFVSDIRYNLSSINGWTTGD